MLPTEGGTQVSGKGHYGTWAASGEIGIVELIGHQPEKNHGTLLYGGQWPREQSSSETYSLASGDFIREFHTFSLEWESDQIRWFVDNVLSDWFSENGAGSTPSDRKFHLLLNLAIGGRFPGPPDLMTSFPAQMVVDYVRVYQKRES